MRELILSQLRGGIKFIQVVENFKSVCSKSTVVRILSESKARMPILKKRGPAKKIDRSMERRLVRALTIGKRPATIRRSAKKEQVSERTVRRMLNRKAVKVFKKKKRFLITMQHAARRKLCCRRFRKTLCVADLQRMVWVDECYIVVGEYLNHQNQRCYGKSFEVIPNYKKVQLLPKSPLRAMVFVGMWSDGTSDLVILRSGFKITSATYIENCLKPLINALPTEMDKKKVIFYQDLAPAHRAKKTQEFLKKNFPCFVPACDTPPSSPDINPLDYCLWSILKDRLSQYELVPNFERLCEILRTEWAAIPKEVIRDSCACWLRRVRKVERANGFHID